MSLSTSVQNSAPKLPLIELAIFRSQHTMLA